MHANALFLGRHREKLRCGGEGKAECDRQFEERDAPRYWLTTAGKEIGTRRLGIAEIAANITMNRWFREAGSQVAKLAEYVAAADEQGLQGDPFRNGVGQMLALAKREATAGPQLPFGPTVVGSSK